MATLSKHMKSVIFNNFNAYREPLQVKFTPTSTRQVDPFSIGYVDGFGKGLIIQGIIGLVDSLEPLSIINNFGYSFSFVALFWKLPTQFQRLPFSITSKEWPVEDLDSPDLAPLLQSLCFCKAQYRHQENPAEYIYESLRSRLKIVQLPSPKAPPTNSSPA